MTTCNMCDGKGTYTGLTESRPCEACGGTGAVADGDDTPGEMLVATDKLRADGMLVPFTAPAFSGVLVNPAWEEWVGQSADAARYTAAYQTAMNEQFARMYGGERGDAAKAGNNFTVTPRVTPAEVFGRAVDNLRGAMAALGRGDDLPSPADRKLLYELRGAVTRRRLDADAAADIAETHGETT